ncbi:MAG: energy transducer TonB [Lewinella sp.]
MSNTKRALFPACSDIADADERRRCAHRAMLTYIYSRISYPEALLEKGKEIPITVTIPVAADGTAGEPGIHQQMHPALEAEALRVIREMLTDHPVWEPAEEDGRPVASRVPLPIHMRKEPIRDIDQVVKNWANAVLNNDPEAFPFFPGCDDVADRLERKACADQKMLDFLYGNLNYPQGSRDVGVDGMVVISFEVEADGETGDPKIERTPDPELGQEALRVVALMLRKHPVWTPARIDGEAVSRVFNLPIRFELNAPTNQPDSVRV